MRQSIVKVLVIVVCGLLFTGGMGISESETLGERLQIRVDGLACPFCAYGLEKKMLRTGKVDHFDIDFQEGKVVLQLKAAAVLSDAEVKQAVTDAGFALRGIERDVSEGIK